MPAPSTVVTLVDEDGDEFPVLFPGVFREYRASDIECAFQILDTEMPEMNPRGKVTFGKIEYLNER